MKLYMFGITGETQKRIKGFLRNMYTEVIVSGKKPERIMVKSGVHQCTALGPLLFLIYIKKSNINQFYSPLYS